MTLANCKMCGSLFLMKHSDYCPACQTEQNQLYIQVREFLIANPNCSVLEVHEKTGIPLSKLLELRKEEQSLFSR